MDARTCTSFLVAFLLLESCHPNSIDNIDDDNLKVGHCISDTCVGASDANNVPLDHLDENPAPVVRIYSPSEGENISGIVVVTWEVLYYDISDGYVEIELDGEVVETPLPLDPVSGNILEPELVFDRSSQCTAAPTISPCTCSRMKRFPAVHTPVRI
jgi:hypothetical protein